VGVCVGVLVPVGVSVGLGVIVEVGVAVSVGVMVGVLVLLGVLVQLAVGTIATGELHAASKQTERNTHPILTRPNLCSNVGYRRNVKE
jgi:hypothetical protein